MLNILRTKSVVFAGVAAIACTPAVASAHDTDDGAEEVAETTNGEWLTLSGSVVATAPEGFKLDYGGQNIRVEMDDYDWYAENGIAVGDEVRVTGRMDADFWENRTVEASSVYVGSRNTLYFASAADEEGAVRPFMPMLSFDPLTDDESVALTGTVTAIDGEELRLDAGLLEYRVDVGELSFDPFDDDGRRHIAVGERVSVIGRMDSTDLFDRREIDAMALTEIG